MKELGGSASATAAATPGRCLDLLAEIEGYPRWYPDVVRGVEALERDGEGRAIRARATLHAAIGPISRDIALTLEVQREGATVRLVRIPHEPRDGEKFVVSWRVEAAGGVADASRIDLVLEAVLDLPRFIPTAGLGDMLASGFVAAAVRELGAPAPATG